MRGKSGHFVIGVIFSSVQSFIKSLVVFADPELSARLCTGHSAFKTDKTTPLPLFSLCSQGL